MAAASTTGTSNATAPVRILLVDDEPALLELVEDMAVRSVSCTILRASNIGEARTESRDVSSRGVYFVLPKEVKDGSPVEIVLTLPHEITLAGPVRVRCLGRVNRNEEEEEGRSGIVAEI